MSVLILGLLIFLGVHSVRIVAEGWRRAQIARYGANLWKTVYSIVSIAGFIVLIYGYGLARREPVVLWAPPAWAPHLAGLLTLFAFILFTAAYVPETHFKAILKHPMVIGIALWAIAHLLANGTLNALVLFGAFLVWTIVDFAAARRRDFADSIVYPAGRLSRDVLPVIIGAVAWALFAFWLHGSWIGVRPFG
ncbi:NnrU family protein [Paraburkholderia sp.]|uniref:NnrU family protein n=1 Tax=Paraburkholderia sp. TaxID=1926495 RepID=UPI003D6EE0E2